MPGIQQLSCLCENGPLDSSSEHRQLSCGSFALYFVKFKFTFLVFREAMISIKRLQRANFAPAINARCSGVISRRRFDGQPVMPAKE